MNFQSILHFHLTGLMRMLLKTQSMQSVHSSTINSRQLEKQAEGYIHNELKSFVEKLETFPDKNDSENNMMTAYALLSSNILSDIDQQLTRSRLKEVAELKEMNQVIKQDHEIMQNSYTLMIAEREQEIEQLQTQMKILEFKNNSLINVVETLNKELQKSTRSVVDLQQKNVEMCLQCAEYKADVDRCNEKITKCIHSKIGYIPTTVLRYIVYIRQLKSPGDPAYFASKQLLLRNRRREKPYIDSSFETTMNNTTTSTSNSNSNIDSHLSRSADDIYLNMSNHSQNNGVNHSHYTTSSSRGKRTILDFRGIDESIIPSSPYTPRSRSLSNPSPLVDSGRVSSL